MVMGVSPLVKASISFRSNMLARAAQIALMLAVAQLPTAAMAQSSSAANADGPVYNLTAEQWRQDLRFMADELQRRHKNVFHATTREQFTAAVADLDADRAGVVAGEAGARAYGDWAEMLDAEALDAAAFRARYRLP